MLSSAHEILGKVLTKWNSLNLFIAKFSGWGTEYELRQSKSMQLVYSGIKTHVLIRLEHFNLRSANQRFEVNKTK